MSEDGRVQVYEWWRKEKVISVELTIHSQYEDEEGEEDGNLDWHTTAMAIACACSYQPWTMNHQEPAPTPAPVCAEERMDW